MANDKLNLRNIPPAIIRIMEKFVEAGAEIYIVGGAVRDILLKKEVKDWDFTTNITPEQMKNLFPKNSFYNNNFGTFSIVGRDGEIFEVTTFRTESGYGDSRHPDSINWGKSLEEDLKRRDFTVNSMAVDINGELIDIYQGQEDLKNGLIKTVGNPDERFTEDALRMMRAIRIAAQLRFLIDESTFESIQRNASGLNRISGERVRDELIKILKTKNPDDGVRLLKNSGLLKYIIPELLEGYGMAQKGHHIYDVWNHSLNALKYCNSDDPVTRLACLLHDIGKPSVAVGEGEERTFHNHEVIGSRMAVNVGRRLRLSKKELDKLFKLVRWHMFTTDEMQTDKAVRRFIRNVTPEYVEDMIALRRGDRLGSGAKESSWRWEKFKKRIIEVQKQPFAIKDLKVNGMDVMEILGIKPGPKVGQVLEAIFKEVEEDPELNQREILMEKIKEYKKSNDTKNSFRD